MGKTAVITGAGQGIGRVVALKLAGDGFHVVLVGRTLNKLETVAAEIAADGEIAAAGGTASAQVLDVTDSAQVSHLAESLGDGPVDVLVNSAGAAMLKPVEEVTDADWDRLLDANLKAPFLMVRALLPNIRRSENASIINIGSKAGLDGYSGITTYSAAKSGLLGFTKSLAHELREAEIRVTMIAPGPVDTPMRWEATPDFDRKLVIDPVAIADMVGLLVALPRGATTNEIIITSMHFA